ncbi:MAG: glycoside hydrolase family 27 protein [Bacteroidales bacterium]|jgi:alpha-galactosidase|nr:glycoside hydrolase family 27 protein [Bacteroidales bacterium]
MKKTIFVMLLVSVMVNSFGQKFENLALTPPMGWNSWNTFATNINEQMIKETADAMVEAGLLDAGYEYLVLDDGWMAKQRDENGKLYGDPKRFPSGMKALGDYIHAKGLKFGIYNCAGNQTCGGYPGSRGHEYMDAQSYADWGVDYLKYDWCNTGKINAESAYITMRDALYATEKPIVLSICEWGDNKPWKWGKDVGHAWRVTGDIINCWDCEVGHGSWASSGIWKIINMRKEIRQYAGPGHWNDYDMMEVGNGMTDAEDRSHFVMWSMLASPLIMGNDVRSASEETLKTLVNKEIIAVNQDSLGIQGFRFTNENNIEIWLKPLSNDEWAMSFINMTDESIDLEFDWLEHEMGDNLNNRYLDFSNSKYEIRDLLKHEKMGDTKELLKATIGSHDVLLIKLVK